MDCDPRVHGVAVQLPLDAPPVQVQPAFDELEAALPRGLQDPALIVGGASPL
jgi:hypothetical protein